METHEPNVALIVGAHPDDTTLGAAGTALLLKRRGWKVVVLTATRGELGGDPRVRVREEEESIASLGFNLHQGTLSDGCIEIPAAIDLVDLCIRAYRPCLLLTHAPEDTHQDHVTLSRAALIASRKVPFVLFYEGPSSQQFNPNVKIDVTTAWDAKLTALQAHKSQISRLDLIRWASGAAHFRSWPSHGSQQVEAFQLCRLSLNLSAETCPLFGMDRINTRPSPDALDRLFV